MKEFGAYACYSDACSRPKRAKKITKENKDVAFRSMGVARKKKGPFSCCQNVSCRCGLHLVRRVIFLVLTSAPELFVKNGRSCDVVCANLETTEGSLQSAEAILSV